MEDGALQRKLVRTALHPVQGDEEDRRDPHAAGADLHRQPHGLGLVRRERGRHPQGDLVGVLPQHGAREGARRVHQPLHERPVPPPPDERALRLGVLPGLLVLPRARPDVARVHDVCDGRRPALARGARTGVLRRQGGLQDTAREQEAPHRPAEEDERRAQGGESEARGAAPERGRRV